MVFIPQQIRQDITTFSGKVGRFVFISSASCWDQIHTAIGRAFGVEAKNFHVPTDTLTRYNPEWEGSLAGDKKWTALFDNSKIKNAVGQFT